MNLQKYCTGTTSSSSSHPSSPRLPDGCLLQTRVSHFVAEKRHLFQYSFHSVTHTPPPEMSALCSSAAHVVTAAPAAQHKGARRARHAPRVRHTRSIAAVSDPSTAATIDDTAKTALELLQGVQIRRATDGETVDAASIVPKKGRVLVPFLTQFADFDSWELAQKLVRGNGAGVPQSNTFTPVLYRTEYSAAGYVPFHTNFY